jgi:hypothetical protein
MNRITAYLEPPQIAHGYDCPCLMCSNCEPDDTGYGSAKDFSEAIERSGGLERVTDEELRDIALGNGWQPVGNGYYHPQVGRVTCVPPCEDAEIVEPLGASERVMCAAIVVGVVVGYCAAIVGVAWVCGKLVGEW